VIEIVPATQELLSRYYGERPYPRIRGFVAIQDGEPIGVGGIAYRGEALEVFSDLKPEMKAHKKTLYKTARRIVEILRQKRLPAYACANPEEPTADRFLTRLGFEQNEAGLYIWTGAD
jgi:hypothetical protein